MNKLVIILFSLFVSIISAQKGEVYGHVTDENGQSIIGANITIENTLLGTATDSKGIYRIINLPTGNYKISASVIGYAIASSEIIGINKNKTEINFQLEPTSYQYDQLIITANKYSQDLREVAASAYVIDSKIFSEKGYQKIDDAFRYVPGVTMTLDQISIRGSSGYSRGAGTRVLVALDGIPIYTPDTGEIIWELIPISEIERVEILKGASSSLYGSSAIGGVINIISKEITSNPVSYFKIHGGLYDNPSFNDWQWTENTLSYNSQSFSHSRSMGKLNLSASVSRLEDMSYRKNDNQLRYSAFLKANYHFSESTSLSFMGTGYTRKRKTFINWKDLQNALIPIDSDLGDLIKSDRTILGMNFNHILNDNFSITFIPSVYISYWSDQTESNNKSSSRLYRSEIRANYSISSKANLISGTEFQYNDVASNIFGDRHANVIGLFSQLDYNIIDPLNLSFGIRYDNSKLTELDGENSISPKFGINYKLDDNTYLRASFGKGFRAPSLAEAFTSTTISGLTVKPNPILKSETSYSFEVGLNHNFYNTVSFDFAVFNNEYFDMIEIDFDPFNGEAFFNNLTRARIQGFDLSTVTSLFSQNLSFNLSYTYLWARDINEDVALKYRPRHTAIAGVNFKHDIIELGIDFRYLSRVEKIDDELVDLGTVPDGDKRVEIYVLDTRIGASLFTYNIPCRLFLNANNLLNYNYVELIGNISPIRNYSLNVEFIF
jgi:outer membrane receptor for ferrienterochelin and colicins